MSPLITRVCSEPVRFHLSVSWKAAPTFTAASTFVRRLFAGTVSESENSEIRSIDSLNSMRATCWSRSGPLSAEPLTGVICRSYVALGIGSELVQDVEAGVEDRVLGLRRGPALRRVLHAEELVGRARL